nr:MAG TPA: hypothetical protein [Caudoviricetes sp.]
MILLAELSPMIQIHSMINIQYHTQMIFYSH